MSHSKAKKNKKEKNNFHSLSFNIFWVEYYYLLLVMGTRAA